MSKENFLTLLFDAIALSFITVATIDFIMGLMRLWLRETVLPEQQWLLDEKADLEFHLESEPVTELPAPPAEPEPAPELPTLPPSLEILQGIDIDTLQLRPARKIAKALGIAQKVNGRDQPLSFLRAQIKARLQQKEEVPPAAIEAAVRELLAS